MLAPHLAGLDDVHADQVDWEDEADGEEDQAEEDGAEIDPVEPDPFIAVGMEASPRLVVSLAQRRKIAIREAMTGIHKIYLNMPAGPGSLAEALATLLTEGRVTAQYIDLPDEQPHIRYEPVERR